MATATGYTPPKLRPALARFVYCRCAPPLSRNPWSSCSTSRQAGNPKAALPYAESLRRH
jgi:hypothetical protein